MPSPDYLAGQRAGKTIYQGQASKNFVLTNKARELQRENGIRTYLHGLHSFDDCNIAP